MGRAWELRWPESRGSDPRQAVNCGHYLLHAPWAHPFWPDYVLMCVSLAEAPGVDPPRKRFDAATHEVAILALDPDLAHDPDDFGWRSALQPPNLVHQIAVGSDRDARALTREFLAALVAGSMSPDTDFRRAQIDLLEALARRSKEVS